MKKITITNAYTWYNKGDAGILLGIVNTLKKIYNNDIEINVLSFTPDEDRKRYCEDSCIKDVQGNILNPHPYKHSKLGKLIAIMKLIIRTFYLSFMMRFSMGKIIESEKSYKILNESDIIVVCGGGFLGGKKFDSLMHLFQIYANTKIGKPVIVMGTSIEPIKSRIIKHFTESILKKVDYIYAREKITYEYLNTFLPQDKFTLIPDMAFMLEDVEKESKLVKEFKEKNNITFGITVRKWNFPNSDISSDLAMENYINSISDLMIKLIKEKNAGFVFIPQVIVEYADDTDVARRIKDRLPHEYKEKFLILDNDLSPIEIKTLIWNMDFFIGTRMHSNIFATSMKIPTVAIAYEKKTNGIMETVGLQDYIVEMDEITSKCLIDKIEICINNNKIIRDNLAKVIPQLRDDIIKKIENLIKVL